MVKNKMEGTAAVVYRVSKYEKHATMVKAVADDVAEP